MKKVYIIVALLTVAFVGAFAIWNMVPQTVAVLPDIEKITVRKSARKLELYHNGKIVKSYTIALGRNPVGHKQREGDSKTPEGKYFIAYHNPKSSYHLSLKISYPDEQDKLNAKKMGVSAGGDIMIHGLPNRAPFLGRFHNLTDWTQGCIAVNNYEIEEIYSAVKDGTPIEILP